MIPNFQLIIFQHCNGFIEVFNELSTLTFSTYDRSIKAHQHKLRTSVHKMFQCVNNSYFHLRVTFQEYLNDTSSTSAVLSSADFFPFLNSYTIG